MFYAITSLTSTLIHQFLEFLNSIKSLKVPLTLERRKNDRFSRISCREMISASKVVFAYIDYLYFHVYP